MATPEKSRTYDASMFNAPEFDARFEQKTKFYHVQLQGSNLATHWGKSSAEKPQGSNVLKYGSHEEALAGLGKLLKEKTVGKSKYELKSEKGSRKISEVPIPEAAARGRKKKAAAEGAEEGEAVAGQKRGRGGKEKEEEKVEEGAASSKAAAGAGVGTIEGESELKKPKLGEGGATTTTISGGVGGGMAGGAAAMDTEKDASALGGAAGGGMMGEKHAAAVAQAHHAPKHPAGEKHAKEAEEKKMESHKAMNIPIQ